ncbi:hypothetical protein L8106_23106 [Lyngbya sp. PCC 8106]|nr:hypothetical protein L8106_23106 [Lyngbya sp. PCC 8106]
MVVFDCDFRGSNLDSFLVGWLLLNPLKKFIDPLPNFKLKKL